MNASFAANRRTVPPTTTSTSRLLKLKPYAAHMVLRKTGISPNGITMARMKIVECQITKWNKQLENLIDLKLHYLQLTTQMREHERECAHVYAFTCMCLPFLHTHNDTPSDFALNGK